MATVQQLEKLHHIKSVFDAQEDSLESAVASERIAQLIDTTEQLLRRRAFLREERRRVRLTTEQSEHIKKSLGLIRRSDFYPESVVVTASGQPLPATVRINVGGLMFETFTAVLCRDAGSLLAQLCSAEPPISPDPEGFFYFDRDWWLFRYIMTFLRDGSLPEDRALLGQLYREANFWNLRQMKIAIEENKLHLRVPTDKEKEIWWRKQPSWWQAIEEERKRAEEEAAKKKAEAEAAAKKADWWKDTKYQGKSFVLAPDPDPKKVTVGVNVEVNLRGKGRWVPGIVARVGKDTVDVALPDTDVLETDLPLSQIRIVKQSLTSGTWSRPSREELDYDYHHH